MKASCLKAEVPNNHAEWVDYYVHTKEKFRDSYVRMPRVLEDKLGIKDSSEDVFGIEVRYTVIRDFLKSHQPVDRLIDIGGNCGYFALSLLAEGLVKEAVVYDVVPDVLEFGRKVAAEMDLSDRCSFINKGVSLDLLEELPEADVIICQYLIHHAGSLFDIEQVKKLGWEEYASQFLSKLSLKYKLGIIANAYKGTKPANWNIAECKRLDRFRNILKKSGWTIRFEKGLFEMMTGKKSYVDQATSELHPFKHFLLAAAWRLGGLRMEHKLRALLFPRPIKKLERYYFYLTESYSCPK